MPLAIAFWVVYLISLVVSSWSWWPFTRERGPIFLVWLLLFMLGWKVFGFPLQS
jgi:hypothetical protein